MPAERIYSPYPPVKIEHPVMLQTWRDLTFLHWRYDAAVIRRLLPPELMLDTFDGAAWIALAPFLITGLRPLRFPAMPWISEFPETNVRTYVLGPDGQPGVWFFTLEAERLMAVLGARALYRLPYRWAAMNLNTRGPVVEYRSRRNPIFGKGSTDLAIEAGEIMDPGNFDHYLTARFRLYVVQNGRVGFAQIDHAPWPLRHGTVIRLQEDLIVNSGVPAPTGEPIVHFSRDLEVRVGPLRWF